MLRTATIVLVCVSALVAIHLLPEDWLAAAAGERSSFFLLGRERSSIVLLKRRANDIFGCVAAAAVVLAVFEKVSFLELGRGFIFHCFCPRWPARTESCNRLPSSEIEVQDASFMASKAGEGGAKVGPADQVDRGVQKEVFSSANSCSGWPRKDMQAALEERRSHLLAKKENQR